MYELSILAEDKPGVLMRIAGVITARGLNINSVSVEPAGEYTSIRLGYEADEVRHEQIRRKIDRLVEVIEVHS